MKVPRRRHKRPAHPSVFLSPSPKATQKFARGLARELAKQGVQKTHALVLGLIGDLGAGKTTFTQGFAQGLGVTHHITSPTFVILRNYPIPRYKLSVDSYKFFCHVDAYRIRKTSELAPLGFKKILAEPKNIVLVEWVENIKKSLPRNTLYINFSHGEREGRRKIEI